MRHTPPDARFLTPGYTLAGLPRLENIYVLTALACSLLLLAACAGHGPQLGPQAPAANAAAASTSNPLELFDPQSICVTYRDDAEFRSLPSEMVAPVATAHLASNPILRPRANFESVTDSIAQHFGLEIREQVYYGRVLMAGFSLPDGTDGDALLSELRSTYADWVSTAEYSLLYAPAFSPDDPVYLASDDLEGGQWNIKHMHIEAAWEHTLGDPGLLLSVVDTGVRMTHSEFGSALLDPAVEFPGTNCDIANDDASIEDNHGHGTFISGQIIAESDNAAAIAGAAPGISMFPVKISDDGGNESIERITAGVMLAYALGAKVISLSWGGGGNEAMQAMTEQLAGDGVLLVCSAGNYGNLFVTYPGAYPDAIATGNSLPDESRMITSSYGPALDLVAPGWNLTSLAPNDDNGLVTGGTGTSYATPLVSSAAALLWSLRPEISLPEMRGLLETSGVEATGFGEGVQVRRLDFSMLFDNAINPSVTIVPPARIVQNGTMPVTLELRGDPDAVELSIDGDTVALLTDAPWQAELNIANVEGGLHQLKATAFFPDSVTDDDRLQIVVAGDPLSMPLAEHFTEGFGICSALDLSQYDPSAMGELAMQDYTGQEQQFRELGLASWYRYEEPGEVPQYQLQIGLSGYGRKELDAVLSQPVHVPAGGNPTLTLEHRCNVTEVLQRIMISDDYGLSWEPMLTTDGELPAMGGFIVPHTQLTLDLAPYKGKDVVVMFLLAAESGSSAQWHDFEWGWWIDVLCFGSDGWIDLPVAEVADPQSLYFGSVPDTHTLQVEPADPAGIAIVRWWLDFPAFQIEQPPDLRVSVSGPGPHGYNFDLADGYDLGNVEARLHMTVVDIHGNVSDELWQPVWQYNLAGDVNADGIVDEADNDALRQTISGSLPWSPFADCNNDGQVDERDNAVVAYSLGAAAL